MNVSLFLTPSIWTSSFIVKSERRSVERNRAKAMMSNRPVVGEIHIISGFLANASMANSNLSWSISRPIITASGTPNLLGSTSPTICSASLRVSFRSLRLTVAALRLSYFANVSLLCRASCPSSRTSRLSVESISLISGQIIAYHARCSNHCSHNRSIISEVSQHLDLTIFLSRLDIRVSSQCWHTFPYLVYGRLHIRRFNSGYY